MRHAVNEIKRIIRSIIAADRAPLALPWFRIIYGKHPVSRIHSKTFKLEWNSYGIGKVRLLLQTVLWPITSGFKILFAVRTNGGKVQKNFGIGVIAQIWDQFILANFYNIIPEHYYYYRLFDRHNRAAANALLVESVKAKMLDQINRGTDCTVLNDKEMFYDKCTEYGLPVIPVFAVVHEEKIVVPSDGNLALPPSDIFMKRSRSARGIGSELWRFRPESNSWSNAEQSLYEKELVEHFIRKSKNCRIILQPRIGNHAALAKLSLGGLCTSRVVTYRFPSGEKGILSAVFRMPRGLNHVDNCAAGGIGAAFSRETGIIGKGYLKEYGSMRVLRHPDTGADISGIEVPQWREVLELAVRAHDVFRKFIFLGWDIAHSEDGPLIVECNTNWGAWIAQVPTEEYLGNTKFVEFFISDGNKSIGRW